MGSFFKLRLPVNIHIAIGVFLYTYKMLYNVSFTVQLSLLTKCRFSSYKDMNTESKQGFVLSALAGGFALWEMADPHFSSTVYQPQAPCSSFCQLIVVCMRISPPYSIRTLVIDLQPPDNLGWSHSKNLKLMTSVKTIFHIRSHSQVLSIRTWTSLFRHHHFSSLHTSSPYLTCRISNS